MAETGSSSGSPLGQSLANELATATDSQRASLPSLASARTDAATTVQALADAADSVPPAKEDSASTQIKRKFVETEDADSGVQCCSRGDGSARQGVDYQSIPDEEYWRYNRYLDRQAGKSKTPLSADAWQEKSVTMRDNNKRGYSFERDVREWLETPIGRGSRTDRTDEGRVPDLPVGDDYGVTDIKNVATLNDSPQMEAFHKLAIQRGLPFNLIVGPNTAHISAPLLDRVRGTGGTVHCYDPANESFDRLEIAPAGYWKK